MCIYEQFKNPNINDKICEDSNEDDDDDDDYD
jgi:hypothetical protein